MKNRIYLFLVIGMAATAFAQERAIGVDTRRVIVVSGDGEASAAPDKAVVRLGAMAQNNKASVAQSQVNEIIEKTLQEIEKVGVPKKSLRTAGLTLSPVYSGNEGQRVSAFRAMNTIEVRLDDVKLVGKVIDAGLNSGANELQGVSFSLKDDIAQRSEALKMAAREARNKAQTLAEALDLRLGSVLEVNEGGVHVMPMNEGFAGGMAMMRAKVASTPIEPGEVRVRASVTVRYELGPGGR